MAVYTGKNQKNDKQFIYPGIFHEFNYRVVDDYSLAVIF